MLRILLKRHPRTLKFASRYLDGDSNFKIETLNQSINQFYNFVIWSSWGGGGTLKCLGILKCTVETSGLSILGQNHTHYFEW